MSNISNEYSSGKAIIVFPAGLCSRKIKGEIVDLGWQKSVIKQSINNNLPIIPAFIEGENSKWFYRIANIRKFLKLKFNLEMLMLPDELYKQKGKKIVIHFGQPIGPNNFSMKSIGSDVQRLKNHVYRLKDNLSLEFN